MDSVRLQVRVPPEIADRLDEIARDLGLTRSGAIRYLIACYGKSPPEAGGHIGGLTTTAPLCDQ